MKTFCAIVLLASVFPALGQVSTTPQTTCSSKFGHRAPASINTVFRTSTIPQVVTQTNAITAFVTATPTPFTETIYTSMTITTTTLSQVTDTFSTTLTFFETIPLDAVWISTKVYTSTVTTAGQASSTYTVPTAPGFTPIASNTAVAGAAKKMKKRVAEPTEVNSRYGQPFKGYPTRVNCDVLVTVISTSTVVTTATTVTLIKPVTTGRTTLTTTVTSTATSINQDHASTTLTFSTTSDIYTHLGLAPTPFLTTTTTVREAASPVSTVYAACAPNNIISTFNGQPIGNIRITAGFQFGPLPGGIFPASNAYECCVQCITASQPCGGAVYSLDANGGGICNILGDNGECNPSRAVAEFKVGTDFAPLELSNGECGRWALASD